MSWFAAILKLPAQLEPSPHPQSLLSLCPFFCPQAGGSIRGHSHVGSLCGSICSLRTQANLRPTPGTPRREVCARRHARVRSQQHICDSLQRGSPTPQQQAETGAAPLVPFRALWDLGPGLQPWCGEPGVSEFCPCLGCSTGGVEAPLLSGPCPQHGPHQISCLPGLTLKGAGGVG